MKLLGKLPRKRCTECENNYRFQELIPRKMFGVTMRHHERFCIACRPIRRFKKNDPKIYVPEWCPNRKLPLSLRVYYFKDTSSYCLHEHLCCALEKELSPEGYRYALVYEGSMKMTIEEFSIRAQHEAVNELLHLAIQKHSIVEIDNGLKPIYLYYTHKGYRYEPHFDVESARKNKYEGSHTLGKKG